MAQPSKEYDIVVMEDVMIPARDGIGLATDLYFPAIGQGVVQEPLPIILERTPYNKRSPDRVEKSARFFARHGYVYAFQDCRGCYQSQGQMDFFWQEGPDGYDTVEWLAAQPWSNKKIGTTGTSYMGWTQNSLAALNPAHLTCMWVNEAAWNGYTSSLRQGGALELRWLCWLCWHAALNTNSELKSNPAVAAALNQLDIKQILWHLPLKKGLTPLAYAPSYEKRALDILTEGDFNELWEHPSVNFELHGEEFADVPIVFSGSWYDSYTRATLESFMHLSNSKQGPLRLLMGPWLHGDATMSITHSGGIELGPDAAIDYNAERLRWFDHWLKGIDNGVEADEPVRIFTMGGGDGKQNTSGRMNHGGHWRNEHQWPTPQSVRTKYYIHNDNSMRLEPPIETNSSTSFRFDPDHPTPTIGGNISSLSALWPTPSHVTDPSVLPQSARLEQIVIAGGWDQRERKDVFGATPPFDVPLSSRNDVLVFQTPPLKQDLEITGTIEVNLWIASDAPDTDFTAKLIDLYPQSEDYPQGFALNLTDGIFRLRYRNSWQHPELMTAGNVYPIKIELYATSNIFGKGHRIRLDISSSNFPRFDVNPNTGEPLGRHTRTQIAYNTIFHSADYPSHVVLPIS